MFPNYKNIFGEIFLEKLNIDALISFFIKFCYMSSEKNSGDIDVFL